MADGGAALEAMIARVREIGGLPARVAPKVAAALERELEWNARRGVGPDGQPWTPTQDGHIPLRGTPAALTVAVEGKTRIVVRLSGPTARHHLGWGRGGVRRQVLPTTFVPDPIVRAVKSVCESEFAKLAGGDL